MNSDENKYGIVKENTAGRYKKLRELHYLESSHKTGFILMISSPASVVILE
jgi:hypothetical protein